MTWIRTNYPNMQGIFLLSELDVPPEVDFNLAPVVLGSSVDCKGYAGNTCGFTMMDAWDEDTEVWTHRVDMEGIGIWVHSTCNRCGREEIWTTSGGKQAPYTRQLKDVDRKHSDPHSNNEPERPWLPPASVYHAMNPTFMPLEISDDFSQPPWPDDFKLVARMHTNDPNTLWHLTNHIESNWCENEDLECVGEPTHRSSSVGDVFVMPDGRILRVAGNGFRNIDNEGGE